MGDLGNIQADQHGVAIIDMEDRHLSLTGINNIIGRGVVIHAGRDDMGKVRISVVVVVVITMVVMVVLFVEMSILDLCLNPVLLI